jgi:hypothetical protein
VKKPDRQPREFAWDGVEFQIPWNWELGLYEFMRKGVSRIEVEDEYVVRLEAEWIRPTKRALRPAAILEKYKDAAGALTRMAHETIEIHGLPPGWAATRALQRTTGSSRKKRGLAVSERESICAIYVCPQSKLLLFVLLHFSSEDKENPEEVMRMIAGSFRDHAEAPLIPWKLFDIAFELPREFKLARASFDVGAKHMVFRWKTRRLHLWHFACADMFLKGGEGMEEWVTGYLNAYSQIRGIVFMPGKNGEILWRRRARHLFGHRNEIASWCFQYKAGCRLDAGRNQLLAWVYHYREAGDLHVIPASCLPLGS